MRAILMTALLAGPAMAQEPVFDATVTASCTDAVSTLPQQRDCIGAAAQACMESADSGYTTVGMTTCLGQELEYWDGRLNAAYQARMTEAKQTDAANTAAGLSESSLAQTLRAAQRAWIPWRDATCLFERAQWGNGTGGGPAALSCRLHMTAEQALYLEFTQLGG